MAINYASKHADKIDEVFEEASITNEAVNDDFDFVGVKTVKVHSVPTVPMNDYVRSGSNRYGSPPELGDEVQELIMGQDRSFTFTVDKGNSEEDPALNAGKALSRQIKLEIQPEICRYRLARIAAAAKNTACAAISDTNAYEKLLDLNGFVDDEKTPEGRVAYVSTAFYKRLKQDSNFILSSEIAQEKLIKGQIGEADGLAIKKGKGRLPVGVDILICHQVATTAPTKLAEYNTHVNPPGISGVLVEGRVYFDAFVLNNKKGALAVHRGSLMPLTATNAAGATDKTKFTAVSGHLGELGTVMGTLVYSIGAAPASIALGADLSNVTTYPVLVLDTDITVTAGDKYIIALKDQNGLCIGTSGAAVACAIGA